MELKEYIKTIMETVGVGQKIHFGIGIRAGIGKAKGKMFVDQYSPNKVKFQVEQKKG